MSDLIKKIKIKKQDGTFTDYIPIGAEAQNVSTSDGDSVQLKLNKKPYYYNSVADMKADTKLKAGDMAITLGYYEPNDGGGAEYKIRVSTNNDVVDEMFIISLTNNELVAELILEEKINVKQLGLHGNNSTDDSTKLRAIIKKLYNNEPQSGWRRIRTLFFPNGTYIIDNCLIDSILNVSGLQFTIEGESRRNTLIICNDDVLFDDDGIFGYSIFSDIKFRGNGTNKFMNFVGGGTGNAQNLQFNRCEFSNFLTILDVSGDTMCSEVTFFESKISSCGDDLNPCELFKFNNPQAVNWRFYATDIESFTGTVFHLLKGTSIYWYQGSCIPIGASKVFSFDLAHPDYFGAGNRPNFTIDGVRFEIRDESVLFYKGDTNNTSPARITMIFSNCGMGGNNIPSTSTNKQIQLSKGGNNLKFENCYNLQKYKISSNTSLGNYSISSDILEFDDTDIDIENVINNSEFLYTGSSTSLLPQIIVNKLNYRPLADKLQFIKNMNFKNQIICDNGDNSGLTIKNATSDVTRTFYVNNYIKDINVIGIKTTAYGATKTFTASFYDDNNTLIGSTTQALQSDTDDIIPCNKYIKTLTMVTTSDYDGIAIRKPLIVSINRI